MGLRVVRVEPECDIVMRPRSSMIVGAQQQVGQIDVPRGLSRMPLDRLGKNPAGCGDGAGLCQQQPELVEGAGMAGAVP